eukprot:COSAG02_NODE_58976_length_275_cov_1.471591_1_plen_53_part_10
MHKHSAPVSENNTCEIYVGYYAGVRKLWMSAGAGTYQSLELLRVHPARVDDAL